MVEKKCRQVVREELKHRRVGLDITALLIWGWIGRCEIREWHRRVGLDEKKRHRFKVVGERLRLPGSCMVLAVLFREANWDRASRGREANVRGDKFDECYNFWFIYKTCLIGDQNPLKLHQWSRLKKILNGGFRFRGTVPPLFGGRWLR